MSCGENGHRRSTSRKATAIHRVVDGQDQIVVVCEGCESIHTVTVQEAMHVALQSWMKFHAEDRHATNTASAPQAAEGESK